GPEGEPGPDLLDHGGPLEDRRFDPDALQGHGGRQAADAAADDQGSHRHRTSLLAGPGPNSPIPLDPGSRRPAWHGIRMPRETKAAWSQPPDTPPRVKS